MLKHVPNGLTIIRILFIPIIISSFYLEDKVIARIFGASAFLIASLTDYFDGFIARKYKINSKFGEIFDPIADKVLVSATILMLVNFNRISVIPCILIISRELIVAGLREATVKLEINLKVSLVTKIKTMLQMLGIFLLLLGSKVTRIDSTDILGESMFWAAAILTVYTGAIYTIKVIQKIL